MSKTLKTIQTLCKIGKIVSKIVFICCIVGFVGSLIGFVCLLLGVGTGELLKIGDVSIHSFIEAEAGINVGTLFAATATGMIVCAGEAVVAKFAELYFRHELAAGTPFTLAGAKELLRLGILTIVIPLVTTIVASIVYEVMAIFFQGMMELEMNSVGSVSTGISFILMSLLCRLGAEQKENV